MGSLASLVPEFGLQTGSISVKSGVWGFHPPPLVPPALTTNALFRWEVVKRKHLSVEGQS